MSNGKEKSPFEKLLKPPPAERVKSKEYWQQQLESAGIRTETPVEPRGMWGLPLEPEPEGWWDNIFYRALFPHLTTGPYLAADIRTLIKTGRYPMVGTTMLRELPSTMAKRVRQQSEEAISDATRAQILVRFYDELVVIPPGVTSYNDYITMFPNTPTEDLTPQDIADMNEALAAPREIAGREELPSWLLTTPEEEVAAKEFMEQKGKPKSLNIQQLTIDMMVKILTASRAVELPEGMSEEEMLRILSIKDMPPESLHDVLDIDTYVRIRNEADLELRQQIDDVKAGVREWEPPDMSFWNSVFFTVQSPMQQFAKAIEPYLQNFAYPLAGTVARAAGDILSTYDIDKEYDETRAKDINPWHAAGVAWEEADIAWYWKLPFELAVDPITWIPGWGLSKPGAMLAKAGSKLGKASMRRFGEFLIRTNKGFYSVMDIPFDAIKSFQAERMLKTFSQTQRAELNMFRQTLDAATMTHSGKPLHLVTKDDLAETLVRARDTYKANPGTVGELFSDLGSLLARHQAMTDKQVFLWSRRHGGGLAEAVPEEAAIPRVAEVAKPVAPKVTKLTEEEYGKATITRRNGLIQRYRDLDDEIESARKAAEGTPTGSPEWERVIALKEEADALYPYTTTFAVPREHANYIETGTIPSKFADIVPAIPKAKPVAPGVELPVAVGKVIDAPIVSEVNSIINDFVGGVLSPHENAKRMARALMMEETPENIAKLIKEIPEFGAKQAISIDMVIRIGKSANINPVARMTEYMVAKQRAIINSNREGSQASGSLLEGIALGLQHKVDRIENWRWRQTLDRYMVRPFAEANLGSVSYPLWNAFEGVAVSLIEGVTPRFLKQEAYNTMVRGLIGDPGLAFQLAGEPVAMGVSGLGRPSFLPSGKIFGWLGRNYIDISNWTGNALKRNYVASKMAQYLAERAYKLAGGDVMTALESLVKNPPKVSKQTLGLSSHELEQELFRRLTVSVDDVLALKSILTDGSLLQGEMVKILRKAEYLSPRAKALGEQLISEGKVFRLMERLARVEFDWSNVVFGKGITPQLQKTVKELVGNLPFDIKAGIRKIEIGETITPVTMGQYRHATQTITFRSVEDLANSNTFYHELGHSVSETYREAEGFQFLMDYTKAIGKGEDAERLVSGRISQVESDRLVNMMEESFAKDFSWYCYTPEDLSKVTLKFFNENFPKTQRTATDSIGDFIKQVSDAAIEDIRITPPNVIDSFRFVANTVDATPINTSDDLMQVFSAYETLSETAAYTPHRMMSQTMDEADVLYKAGKFGDVEPLWREARQGLLDAMQEAEVSLELVRNKIIANIDKLTGKRRMAMESVLERSRASNMVREATLRIDGERLDAFFAIKRTSEEHTAFRAQRHELWETYKMESAIPSAGEFITRKKLAKIYHDVPEPKLIPVNVEGRALSNQDIANVFGVNIDGLISGMLDNIAMHGKSYFIQLVKQSADTNPNIFKGFTEEKIAQVFDNIMAQSRMRPDIDIATQKILQQAEGMRQDLISLKMRHSLTPDEEKALHAWVDNAAEGRGKIIGEAVPETDIGLGGRVPTPEEASAVEAKRAELFKEGFSNAEIDSMVGSPSDPILDYAKQQRIVKRVTELAERTQANGGTLEDLITRWFGESDMWSLNRIGDIASSNAEYRAGIQKILKENYPSRYIRIYRGQGAAKGRALEREYTNVTSSRGTAKTFEDSWDVVATPEGVTSLQYGAPEIDNILIKVEDVLAIGSVDESELFIRASVLRDRMTKPLTAPGGPGKALVSPDDWRALRQSVLDDANKDYYKTFADYTNETILGGFMKMIYPYWSYHSYRWFFLGRTALRHPGLPVAWGKYQNYGENGFLPTWFPDIEMNPFVGSVLGTTFSLTRFDFSSYYNQLGWAGEMLDYSQRLGFFPGAHVMTPIALTPYLSGRPVELGEITPPIVRSGINAFIASNVPGVSSAAKWLKDRIFHENFHEYYTATILSNKQIEAGGKLLTDPETGEPVSGIDIWFKLLRKEKLTPGEQQLWDESYREAAKIGVLRSQFPQFRLRTEEYKEAYKQVTQLIEQETGMTEAFQKELWKNHQRPTDVIGSDYPLDLRMALDEVWQWKIMMGRGTILMPPDASDLRALTDDYLRTVKSYQQDRVGAQVDFNNRFLFHERTTNPLDGREWRREYATNWTTYTAKVDGLKGSKKYADAVYALTPEGRQEAWERLGFNITPSSPMGEVIELYFGIELEKKLDTLSGEEDWDYLTFWLKREAVRMALTEEQRAEFDQYIRKYQTPTEEVFRYAYNTYIRGYYATSRIIFQTFTDDERALIKEFHAKATTRQRQDEIQSVVRADGRKLVSQYNAQIRRVREDLRTVSPTLDFYLYVFGYGTKPITNEAKAMIDRWEADRTSILRVL